MSKETEQTSQDKALDNVLLQVEKQFGKGAIYRLGDKPTETIPVYETGVLQLDYALGVGGVPVGRIVEIYGPESSGKTSLALNIIATAQKKRHTEPFMAAFIDAEHSLDPQHAKNLGVDIDKLMVSQPDNGEQALEIAEALVRSGAVNIIVIDSVAALVPKSELEGDMGQASIGVQARLMSQALRKLTGAIYRSNCTVIFINQLRMKIGVMFGCFPYHSFIYFADGRMLPIGKVVTEKIQGDVWSYNPQTKKLEAQPITDWHQNGEVSKPSDFYHLRLTRIKDGYGNSVITATKNHKFYTSNRGWVELKDLKPGDTLLEVRTEFLNGEYEKFAYGCLIDNPFVQFSESSYSFYHSAQRNQADPMPWYLRKLIMSSSVNGYSSSSFCFDLYKLSATCQNRGPVSFFENFSPVGLAAWFSRNASWDKEKGTLVLTVYNQSYIEGICQAFKDRGYDCSIATAQKEGLDAGSRYIEFTKDSAMKVCELIAPYLPESEKHVLPAELAASTEDFELQKDASVVYSEVYVAEVNPVSDSVGEIDKRKFDISIANNKNYAVGNNLIQVIAHNSPETTTGGNALKFYSSIRLDVRKSESITKGEEVIGHRIKVKVVKNKVAPPFKKCEFDFYFDSGFDEEGQIADLGVELQIIKKSGAWFSYKEERLGQGRDNLRTFLKENPKIKAAILEEIKKALTGLDTVEPEKKTKTKPAQTTTEIQ